MKSNTHLNRIACVLLILLTLTLAAATVRANDALVQDKSGTYVDATGHEVQYGIDARRIVSLAPNLTEMVFQLGLSPYLVGRTDFCNYPPEVLNIPTVGGFVDTSLEKVIALKPDLVLAYQGNSLELVEQLRQAGITVLAFNEPQALSDIFDQMKTIWKVAGPGGDDLPAGMKALLDKLKKLELHAESSTAAANNKPVVFFGYPGENTLTCGGGSFLDNLITLAGGVNAAHDVQGRWPVVSAEFLVAANPNWILTATPCAGEKDPEKAKPKLLAELQRDPVWSSLDAVKQGHVLVLDADILLRPGPRIVQALEQLKTALMTAKTGAEVDQP